MQTPEPKLKMVRVVIYLPRELSDQLDHRANKAGLSRSEVIRHDILTAAEKPLQRTVAA